MQISDKGLTTAQVAFGNYIERGMGNSCCRSANLLGRHESRANPAPMGAALSIIHRANSGFLISKAGLSTFGALWGGHSHKALWKRIEAESAFPMLIAAQWDKTPVNFREPAAVYHSLLKDYVGRQSMLITFLGF